jgi:hypothetical protein
LDLSVELIDHRDVGLTAEAKAVTVVIDGKGVAARTRWACPFLNVVALHFPLLQLLAGPMSHKDVDDSEEQNRAGQFKKKDHRVLPRE